MNPVDRPADALSHFFSRDEFWLRLQWTAIPGHDDTINAKIQQFQLVAFAERVSAMCARWVDGSPAKQEIVMIKDISVRNRGRKHRRR